MLAVPPAILDLLHLEAGASVGLAVDGERLVVQAQTRPQSRPKYTLDELLARCDGDADFALTDEDRAWVDLAPAGREI